jgi:hypothetical protein
MLTLKKLLSLNLLLLFNFTKSAEVEPKDACKLVSQELTCLLKEWQHDHSFRYKVPRDCRRYPYSISAAYNIAPNRINRLKDLQQLMFQKCRSNSLLEKLKNQKTSYSTNKLISKYESDIKRWDRCIEFFQESEKRNEEINQLLAKSKNSKH